MSNRLQNFEQIKECVQNLINCIPIDGVVDLQPLFFRLTFDTTTFLLFGKSMSALNAKNVADQESEFAKAFNLGQEYLSHRGRLGEFYWLMSDRAFRNACKVCHRFVDQAIKEALEDSKKPTPKTNDQKEYIFIDALIQETQDPKVLRDQCLNILLAGRDTTACCLSWTLCVRSFLPFTLLFDSKKLIFNSRLLARHQGVLDRLRSEIESTVGIGADATPPSMTDLKRMSYLNLVIKEGTSQWVPVLYYVKLTDIGQCCVYTPPSL